MEENLFNTFPETKNDGLLINWSHRTNTRQLLAAALDDPTIHCIEADIRHSPRTDGVYVAHNVADIDSEDFPLASFLGQFFQHDSHRRKGLKLDFKSVEAVRRAFRSFAPERIARLEQLPAFWLNADIVGSDAEPTPLVEPSEFLALCRRVFPKSSLSVGFSVPAPAAGSVDNAAGPPRYTRAMVEEMARLLATTDVRVTFPLRVGYLPVSHDEIVWLVGRRPEKYSVTLWHSADDEQTDVLIEAVVRLRASLPLSRLLYDLPSDMIQRIRQRVLL